MNKSNGITFIKSGLLILAVCSLPGVTPRSVAAAEPAQSPNAALVTLVQEGGPQALVIVPEEIPATGVSGAREGALEIAEYLEKMTARTIPVVVEGKGLIVVSNKGRALVPFSKDQAPPQGTPEIHVGWTAAARKAVDKKRVDALDEDGFLIQSAPERVYIVGKTALGTYYGCLWLLEKYCGVRWYMPGDIGEDVLLQATVRIPRLDQTFEPAFKHRELSGIYLWKTGAIDDYPQDSKILAKHIEEGLRWARRARLRSRLNYHHNLKNVFPVEKYGKLYPDLYPLQKGRTERYIPDPKHHDWQPCLTHPKAVDLAMDYAREYFAKNPTAGSISLALNDGGLDSHCVCERCLKTTDLDLPPNQQRARQYFTFLNAVAERFDKEFPDKCIGHLLYGGASRYPQNMKINPRLVTFPVKQSYRKYLPGQWKEVEDELTRISQSTSEFGIYDWLHGSAYGSPRPQPHLIDSYLKAVYGKGCRHYKGEAYSNWGVDAFRYWVITQLLWDPKQNVDDLLNDFFNRFFRESAAPMRVYFDTCEEYLQKAIRRDLAADPDEKAIVDRYFRYGPGQYEALPPEAIEKCAKALDEAMALARSQIVLNRVDFFRKGFGVGRIMSQEYHACKQVMALCAKPETHTEALAVFAQILKPEMNVQLYYDTVILPDPCVVRPGSSQFGSYNGVLATLVNPIRNRVMDIINQGKRRPMTVMEVDAAVQQAVREDIAGVLNPSDRQALRETLGDAAGKIIVCNAAKKAPVVDGDLSDACWQAAPVNTGFTWTTQRPLKYNTFFQVVYHGNRLYVAVRCARAPGEVAVKTNMRDQNIWRDDSIEFFLNKLGDTTADQRFQVVVNAKGNIFDYYDGKAEWNGDIQVATKIEPASYFLEFSVPLDAIGIDPAKMPFVRCNVLRDDISGAGKRTGEVNSYWAPAVRSFPDPLSRGLLLFNKPGDER